MGQRSEVATPDNSDEESGDAFTDGDFGDSEEETIVERHTDAKPAHMPINETVNDDVQNTAATNGHSNGGVDEQLRMNGRKNSEAHSSDVDSQSLVLSDLRRDSHGEQNPSIVGILGDQQNHAEQRLAARRAARAEAREIRMRELERQQREQEDHADKAYDMYAGKTPESVGRRGGTRLASLSPAVHSPRRSSEDSMDDGFSVKDLRHELKEVEEKFRKAMILNAQLDNDKAALGYQLELLKDRIEELHEEYAQLQREHREKCSSFERLKREHESVSRELGAARDAVRARDAAAAAAGFAFVDAASLDAGAPGAAVGAVPALALLTQAAHQLLDTAGEGTLDVRLQKLLSSKQALESEVRKLKLQLNEERAARQNGVTNHHDQEYENELETVRKAVSEAKGRAARAEAEAALQAAHVARLEAQLARLRARQDHQDEHEEQLKHERRRLQREAREALNRVEELETENSHLTKRLDKLKNAKSALLKDL
ncbi:leucine-rich repeat flightless-interacting protein 2 isoform X1 [Spodoptera litura]|uniref:Leucine-rich repeat flightless-interacting protein 2 isoform X1 n=1 Tax=Spodoptera litura TaxID=69820 RepID=A0A9J7IM66_SPOLT|nr:leucine-rich repeat flightless-interacting protein 2 isoform X1 [Spodoptera litura]